MTQNKEALDKNIKKSPIAEREEKIFSFWKQQGIFEKALEKASPQGEFVFFEGPPTANGKPGIHHLLPRAFKDAIPRYKTMQGFHVRRKGGWDTHGLPVELQVEKELGLKSKKEIEVYGLDAFNKKCRESVWKYVREWEEFTGRIGHWIDLDNPYITYDANYVESLWSILKTVHQKELLYKDYKVVPWCPRCGTGLSSHELAQGYEDVKDLSVTVKLKVVSGKFKSEEGTETYFLAWTTTPWTLSANVGLAVGEKITYTVVRSENVRYILAKDRVPFVFKDKPFDVVEEVKGHDLVGLEYEPLYLFLKDNLSETEKPKLKNAFKVYPADFVTTTDGTGIVHTAVMYGTDDFELGTKVGLPKHHMVNEDGTFKPEAGFLAGKFVKDPETDVAVIKDLAGRGLLFAKEKYAHSYPHCWRCKTPLIYYARDSWYIAMSKLRDKLVSENKKIHWEPDYIKDGRFGEWINEVKDWAISRERYWGTPLPVWNCESCKKHEVLGSFDEIRNRTDKLLTKIIFVRHGESEKNKKNIFSSKIDGYPLTKHGEEVATASAKTLAGEVIDAIYTSPVLRTGQTAKIIAGAHSAKIVVDDRLREVNSGSWDEKGMDDLQVVAEQKIYKELSPEDFFKEPRGKTGESWKDVEERMVDFLNEIISLHKGKTVMIVSHEGPLGFFMKYVQDVPLHFVKKIFKHRKVNGFAVPKSVFIDSLTGKEFNPHRPRVDDIELSCPCGGIMRRVKEVVDVWFDSGAMPFAQDHYPFENKALIDGDGYPADFISEAIDQTRGWFYTLHAIGALLGKGSAYKNVICLGHILDSEGRKMSKSVGNVIDPNIMIAKYGVDPLRFWMYSVNQPGEPKNFEEKTVEEIVKKVFNLTSNVLVFYQLYASSLNPTPSTLNPTHVLDVWIIAKLNQLVLDMTVSLDAYKLLEPTRAVRDFIAELSQWYLRRSRDRFKGEDEQDKQSALSTTRYVLLTLSKLMAPFTPFFAESLYRDAGGEKESVHLEAWPESQKVNAEIIEEMSEARRIVSLALEARAKASIKIRQPLQQLKVKSKKLKASDTGIFSVIKDEVNVKNVLLDNKIEGDVELDTMITAELEEEGAYREFVRMIQDARKDAGLNPGDVVTIAVRTDEKGKKIFEKFKKELMKVAQLSDIELILVVGGPLLEISIKK